MSTPDDSVEICSICVTQYLSPMGGTMFGVKRVGDVNMSTWLGLLRLAEDAILRQYNEELRHED